MRNTQMERLDVLAGDWKLTESDAWFLEPKGIEVYGTATVDWLGESFLVMRLKFANDSESTFVFGRSDADDRFGALYHDDRGVCREFTMTFDHQRWTMVREDPDFHQRFTAEIATDRVAGRWEASDDMGGKWRKDYDLTFSRRTTEETSVA